MNRITEALRLGLRRLFWPPPRLAGVVVVAAVIYRIARWAPGFPLWGDESFIAVNFLTRGFGDMVEGLDHAQVVPLGFLWLTLALSKLFGPSEQVLRLLPMLAGVLSLVLLWRWAPRALPRRQAYLGVAILAASYYPTRHANEVKPYAVDLLVALVVTVLAWWVWQRMRDPKRWGVLALAGGVAVWFSYPSVFVTSGVLLALLGKVLADRDARTSIVAWLGGFTAGLTFLLSAGIMWRLFGTGQSAANEGLRGSDHWSLAFPPSAGDTVGEWLMWPLRFAGWFLEVHTGNMLAYPAGGKNAASSFTFILVTVGILALWRRRHPLLWLLVLPAGMCLLAAALRLYPYGSSARTTLFLAPGICLIAGVGGVTLMCYFAPARRVIRGLRAVSLLLLLVVVSGAVTDVLFPYKHPSDLLSRDTLHRLAQDADRGDRWVVVGAMHDTPWAPNMIGWGGSAARTRHYLLLEAERQGVDLQFAPDPAALQPINGQTVVIEYRDNKYAEGEAFPAEQVRAYTDAAEQGLGVPEHIEETELGKGEETLWFRFYPAPSDQ